MKNCTEANLDDRFFAQASMETAMIERRSDDFDERAIRTIPRDLEEAWNRGDAFSYAALFTDDCDYVAFDGTRVNGRAGNARLHQQLFDSVLYGSKLRLTNVTLRFITSDLALMHAEASVSMPWESADTKRRRSLHTYVVVRDDDGWRITASQSVTVRPLSVPSGWARRLLRALFRLRTAFAAARGLEPAGGW